MYAKVLTILKIGERITVVREKKAHCLFYKKYSSLEAPLKKVLKS